MKDDTGNPLNGLGRRLRLHLIIPILYAAVLIAALIIGQSK